MVDTESLVPAAYLLRKIDAAIDFSKIYDMIAPLYCTDNGRPSVDPVVLFKKDCGKTVNRHIWMECPFFSRHLSRGRRFHSRNDPFPK